MVIYRNKLYENWSQYMYHQIFRFLWLYHPWNDYKAILKISFNQTLAAKKKYNYHDEHGNIFQLFLRNTFCGFLRYLLRHQGLFNSVKRIPVHFIDGCNCKIYYMHRCYYYSVITTKIAYSTQCNKPFWSYVHVIFYA